MKIQNDCVEKQIINKSEFIAILHRVESVDEAKEYLAQVKKEYPNANHYCYGMIINSTIQRSNDDGEPASTAGVPILSVLIKNELTNVIGIVIRYFGGIKLGAGGLIRAYSSSISLACKNATFYQEELRRKYFVEFDYAFLNTFNYAFKEIATVNKMDYGENIKVEFVCKDDPNPLLQEISKGKYSAQFIEELTIEVSTKKS